MPSHELPKHTYAHNLKNRVKLIRQFPDKPVLAEDLEADTYVDSVFDGATHDDVYVRRYSRPADGFGAHFDVYNHAGGQLLHEEYPFIATYNIHGQAVLRATALSEALQADYDANFPRPTAKAHAARRDLGNYALSNPNATIYTHAGTLAAHSGIVIPQVPEGPYVVHDVRQPYWIAKNAGLPAGFFLKFAVPADNESRDTLQSDGYVSYTSYKEQLARNSLPPQAYQPKEVEKHSYMDSWRLDDELDDGDNFDGFDDIILD